MSFVQRELDRIAAELRREPRPNDFDLLYVAQQALAWAVDPAAAKAPLAAIRGTREGSEGYSGAPRLPSS